MADVAGEVLAMMARRRLSQVEVSKRAKIAPSTLSRKLLGGSDFTVAELYRLADVLDVPAAELLPSERAEASA